MDKVYEELIRLFEADPVGWHFSESRAYYNQGIEPPYEIGFPTEPRLSIYLDKGEKAMHVDITRPREEGEDQLAYKLSSYEKINARIHIEEEAAAEIMRVFGPAFQAARAEAIELRRWLDQENAEKYRKQQEKHLDLLKGFVRRVEAGQVMAASD